MPSILWRTADEAPTAALAMKMTAADQLALGVIDVVVPEPGAGAQAEPAETARRLKAIILDRLGALEALTIDELIDTRYRRYRALGPTLRRRCRNSRRRRAGVSAIACAI